MEVESQSDDERSLIVNYTNSTWGAMRTAWKFVVEGDKMSRFETGQPAEWLARLRAVPVPGAEDRPHRVYQSGCRGGEAGPLEPPRRWLRSLMIEAVLIEVLNQ
jgi:hypothetical protein